jgi:ubiquinone/menaquinone biosynthesis C-methylase UbiE
VIRAKVSQALGMPGSHGEALERPPDKSALDNPAGDAWARMYARQAMRTDLIGDWMDALGLKAGDRVLEVGAGPGYVSFALAERVGPAGLVYAVDRSADALAYLERRQAERGVRQIRRLVADAATLSTDTVAAGAALITMVLHHADDPAGIVRAAAQCVTPGARVLIGEFDPDGPCEIGVGRDKRLRAEQVRAWCEAAGLAVIEHRQQTPEHYLILAQKHHAGAPQPKGEPGER